MEYKIIDQHEAIKLLEAGEDISVYKVLFNEEKVEALKAIILGKNKIEVPSDLIFYDDDTIDFSDYPGITSNDFEKGKLVWEIKTSLPVDNELRFGLLKNKFILDNR